MGDNELVIDSLDGTREAKEYWINLFSADIEKLSLYGEYQMNVEFELKKFNFRVYSDLYFKLDKLTNGKSLAIYTLLLSVLNIQLFKYTSQSDFIVGTPAYFKSNRDDTINQVVPIRNRIYEDMTFKNVLVNTKEALLETYKHQIYPLSDLLKEKNIMDIRTILPINFIMKNFHNDRHIDYILSSNKNEVTFLIEKNTDSIDVELVYNPNLFKYETINKFSEVYLTILKQGLNDIDIKLSELHLLSIDDENKLLNDFNNTNTEYPRDKTLQELFEEQVEKTPDNIAVVWEDKDITYRELNKKSNVLARALRKKGVKSENIVGIMLENPIEMIIGILGVLKSGAAYLPIDLEYPEERIKYILEDSGADILLLQNHFKEKFNFNKDIFIFDDIYISSEDVNNIDIINNAKNLAYIIYTSGSTGKPKGVMVEQKSVVRLIKNQKYIELDEYDRILQTSSFVFDVSIFEMWGSLLNGLRLYLVSKEIISSTDKLRKTIINNRISILWLTSTLFNQLAQENDEIFKSLKYLLIGGDVLSPKHINLVRNKCINLKILNGYGPTENTVFSTTFLINKEYKTNIPIGKPITNSTAYIMDKNNKLLPIGVRGELCVGGDGVARGYINNEKMTREKFVKNPYRPLETIYRTGDLARWLPNGDIEFLGRMDHQVKIRGFRIELDEIENNLLNLNGIKEAVVIDMREEDGVKSLCAYLTVYEGYTVGHAREELKKNIPHYMIPSYFIMLEKMPLNINGKIDRKALPDPHRELVTESEYEASRNDIEKKLVLMWEELLGINRVGINDNFFEIGGHSLKATVLIGRIYKEFNVEIPLKELYKSPNIKEISQYIFNAEERTYVSIKPVEEKEYYELSSAQKRIYMLQQFDIESTGYNMPGAIIIEGVLKRERVEKAFCNLVRRHEALRTSFENIEERIVQRVKKEMDFKVEYVEEINKGLDIEKVVNNFVRPFDLEQAPLLRVRINKIKEEKYIVIFDMHHIISDGISMEILISEFVHLYEGKTLDKINIQYKDYAEWQNTLVKSDKIKKQEEYWINRLSNEVPVLNMPIDFLRPTIQSFEGDSIKFKLDKRITKELKKIIKETGSTMYMILLSGVNILLSKYSGQEDIIIGTPIAGRSHVDLEKVIGMFVNTLSMRNHPEENKTYEEFLKEVKENALKAYENQDYPFEELVDKLNLRRDISRNPLFDVMFTMENIDSKDVEIRDLIVKELEQVHRVAKFDLTFSATEAEEEIILDLEYCTKLYKRETIERMVEHFKNILEVVVQDKKIKLSEITMITKEEEYKLLYEFNDTYVSYSKDKTISELFEEQVEKTPEQIAVVFEDKKLTYRELNERSNQLARTLRKKGIKADGIVAIMLERSLEMIVSIMGILKSGGAYLPLDPEYPDDRIEYMLQDSGTQILVTYQHLKKISFNGDIIELKDRNSYDKSGENLDTINKNKDLAYVIYTSGSTGKPKGVMIEQKNVINLCNWYNNSYNVKMNKNTLQITNIVFDVAVLETIVVILNGGTIYIPRKETILDKCKFREYVNRYKINSVQFVPVTLNELVVDNDFMESLSVVISGGDRLENPLKSKVISMGYKLYNHYGPTETTVDTIITPCSERNIIGKPVENSQAYIIDQSEKLQPIGIPGEICIGGDGVARGYLNKFELTAEKFIENPFIKGEKIYKTGDLGRWLSDGNIEFLGRIDHQVKIRGIRIELGEIESQLLRHESVKEVSVIDRKYKTGEKYLCAYIVADEKLTSMELREYLSENLPEYMIPSCFVKLEKMPLNSNGKVDRKALPEADTSKLSINEYEEPKNKLEEKLADIWSKVLKVDKIGMNDNFFYLGGHSLNATILMLKIYKELKVDIPLKELFKTPTIRGISNFIESADKDLYAKIEKIEEKEYYEASSAQKRMFLLQEFNKDSTAYNIPIVYKLEGKVDKTRIEKTFIKLIERHEALRTYFETIDGEIVQKIDSIYKFEMIVRQENEQVVENIISGFIKPFKLNKGPLFRMEIVENLEKSYLLIDIHHIISDGISISILVNEFINLYNGKELKPLKIQYKDFAEWQNRFLKSEEMKKQEEYWIDRFKDKIPVLSLPYDYERPAMQSFEGDSILFTLDKDTTNGLRKIARETDSTMHMVLLSIFNILLAKHSEQEDIMIGTPIGGRTHGDLDNIMGMFVNTLVLRNRPEGKKTYMEFLKDVKENSLKAYENQSYQFEELVKRLNIRRDISRNFLFDVMFNMITVDNEIDIYLDGVLLKEYDMKSNISKFDITLSALDKGDSMELEFKYCIKIFKRETIERFIEGFKIIIEMILKNKNISINKISILNNKEQCFIDSETKKINELRSSEFNF